MYPKERQLVTLLAS